MLPGFAAVLTAAMVLQFGYREAPCPLCLLERMGLFGICSALILQLRAGDGARSAGFGLLSALFLLVVSTRQVLNDLCRRLGHAYVGSAVLGLLDLLAVLAQCGFGARHAAG